MVSRQSTISRRRLLVAAASLAAASAIAQQSGRTYRIAVWRRVAGPSDLQGAPLPNFAEYLAKHGFVAGGNTRIRYLFADATGPLSAQVQSLLADGPDVIVVAPGRYEEKLPALLAATNTIPIVLMGFFWGEGYPEVYKSPAPNVTGVMSPDLTEKRLEVARDLLPDARRVALVWANYERVAKNYVARLEASAKQLNIEITHVDLATLGTSDGQRFERAIAGMAQGGVDAFLPWDIGATPARCELLSQFERRYRAAHISLWRDCGVVRLRPESFDTLRIATEVVARILRGAKPADLPMVQNLHFSLEVDAKLAREMQIVISPSLRLRATRVFE